MIGLERGIEVVWLDQRGLGNCLSGANAVFIHFEGVGGSWRLEFFGCWFGRNGAGGLLKVGGWVGIVAEVVSSRVTMVASSKGWVPRVVWSCHLYDLAIVCFLRFPLCVLHLSGPVGCPCFPLFLRE